MSKQLNAIHHSSGNSSSNNDNFDIKCGLVHYDNKSQNYSHQGPKDGYRCNHGFNSHNRNNCFSNQFKQQLG